MKLGDRVTVNHNTKYGEWVGFKAEVIGMHLHRDRTVNVTISDEVPWRGVGGTDGFTPEELDVDV